MKQSNSQLKPVVCSRFPSHGIIETYMEKKRTPKLVTVKTFMSSFEAEEMKGWLDSEGIKSFIMDENIMRMNPWLSILSSYQTSYGYSMQGEAGHAVLLLQAMAVLDTGYTAGIDPVTYCLNRLESMSPGNSAVGELAERWNSLRGKFI